MHISFLGAAQEVTGSMHLLHTEHGTVLVDCGMFQGRREESRRRNSRLPDAAVRADAVILTHAHIDHSGSLPTLVKQGFGGSIYSTPATRDLCSYMLRDSARIQMGDAAYLNKRHAEDPDWVPIQPLYDEDDAIKALDHFVTMAYRRRFQVFPGVRATFIDAGHILGSAQIVFDIEEKGKSKRIVMSGDLGRKGLPILRDPDQPPLPVDYAIMESTYGSRAHGDIATMHDDLARVVAETAKRGGKVIIPAFAVGRTQEVLYSLHHLERTNRLPAIPVFIDSPLSVNITEVFKLHPDCYDAETAAFLEEHGSVFGWDRVRMITAREESMRLNDLKGPAIIIASSGMCEAGRILHHLRNNVEDDRNTILIVGFQAAHTLGRRLVERRPRVRIFGVERDLRAHVKVLNAFSAHGDMHDLMDFATSLGPDLKKVFLVHGEPDQQAGLLGRLAERKIAAAAPAVGEEVGL